MYSKYWAIRSRLHQITLDLDLAPDIPSIMADHNRLEQVFINLVTNAIDAMDEKAEQTEHKGMEKKLVIRTRIRRRQNCCHGGRQWCGDE